MRLLISTIVALGFLHAGVAAETNPSPIEGVFCDTLEQVVQIIRTSDGVNTRAAIKSINAESGKLVCAFAEFLGTEVGSKKNMVTYPHQEVINSTGTWQPLKVLIVGIVTSLGIRYFKPRYVYTAFLKMPATPGINI